MADPIIEEFKRRAFISQLRGMSNPAGELNANLLEGGTISAQPRPQSTLEAWYSGIKNLAHETFAPMSRVGSAMLGKTTLDSYPQIDEINDPKTLRLAQAKDVLEGVLNYSAGPTLLGKPTLTGLSAAGARAETKSPLWRSQMQDVLTQKLPGKGDPKQIAQTIESFAKKGEFKPEELEWSGLRDWLSQQSGKVSKDDVIKYLQDNNVQVQEVFKGSGKAVSIDDIKNGYLEETEDGIWKVWQGELPDPTGEGRTAQEALNNAAQNLGIAGENVGGVVYGQYQLPGGENYRELLLTLPEKLPSGYSVEQMKNGTWAVRHPDGTTNAAAWSSPDAAIEYEIRNKTAFRSTHYQEPNILAHVRFNERVDADGKRVLFIEEIQSDWAQKGRKEGFKETFEEWKSRYEKEVPEVAGAIPESSLRKRYQQYIDNSQRVPDAPFVKDTGKWSMLAMKRMVRYAADNGFDRIAWTTGEHQAARYDLSKQVRAVEAGKSTDGLWDLAIEDNNGNLISGGLHGLAGLTDDKLSAAVGKDLAKKIVNQEGKPDKTGWHRYEGVDLKVGGEGMKGFYDKILPAEVNKFFGKEAWGKARVGETKIVIRDKSRPFSEKELDSLSDEDFAKVKSGIFPYEAVHSLDITPQMREKATKEGMPLFQMAGATAGLGAMQKEDNDYAEQAINDRIAQNKALKNGS